MDGSEFPGRRGVLCRRDAVLLSGFCMRAVDVIRNKRNGRALERAEIDYFVAGVTDGTLPDYQASALLMAILNWSRALSALLPASAPTTTPPSAADHQRTT